MDLTADRIFDLVNIRVLRKDTLQYRIINFLCHAHFLRIHIYPAGDVNHQVGQDFDIALLSLDPYIRNCRVLDIICQFTGHSGSFFRQDLTGGCVYHILRKDLTFDAVAQCQFLIEFIRPTLARS